MPEVEEIEPVSKLDKAKEVIKNNWKPFAIGVALTTVTVVVTRRLTMRYMHIEGTNAIIRKAVIKDDGALYKVFNFYGPGFKNHGLSWMVKCKETGVLFRSQEQAAKVMGLSESSLSTHLNRQAGHVKGYHFERVGVVA